MKRKIVRIDEEKCDGCGLCIPSCREGAIRLIDGKARLVKEAYCDGLGDCLGECPRGAITIEEREADPFDPEAVAQHLAVEADPASAPAASPAAAFDGCPGAAVRTLRTEGVPRPADAPAGRASPSALANWPVQLMLAPVEAPYFEGARLLIAADCTAFAFADFHAGLLAGKMLLVGCPKLDAADIYTEKLADIFTRNDIRDIEVVHMEVPCCHALKRLVQEALSASGKEIPLKITCVGVRGEIK